MHDEFINIGYAPDNLSMMASYMAGGVHSTDDVCALGMHPLVAAVHEVRMGKEIPPVVSKWIFCDRINITELLFFGGRASLLSTDQDISILVDVAELSWNPTGG